MGRWDNNSYKRGTTLRINKKKIKYIILGGFVVVAIVVLSVFIPRAGLTVEILERSEAMHSVKTISVKVNNNNPQEIKDVIVQFGENGKQHTFGNIGPFGAIFITPDPDELNFDKVIVSANGGSIQTVKLR
ncbi:MAG TPA: hypothetical protein VLA48_09235 [Nitrososphaeraceae archaeon]|nr:hypothetical protein [Nitrososphaeraceae archaeon]